MRQDSGDAEVVSVGPPQLTREGATLYAAADRVYALDAATGALLRTYETGGHPHMTVTNGVLYVGVTAPMESKVQALRASDRSEIRSFAFQSAHLALRPSPMASSLSWRLKG